MSDRYRLAVVALQTSNLLELSRLLSGAVQECLNDGQMPHMDPAVRLICCQIAMAGNGDLTLPGYYEDVVHFCAAKAHHAANADFPQEIKDVKPPPHQAS